jgi:hypothetical protein
MDKAPYLICITCIDGATTISEIGRCTCQVRTAYLHQCKHERAVLKGRFASHLWQKRWKRRFSIVMSNGNSVIAESVIEDVGVIGQPKEPEEESDMFPDVDDDESVIVDGIVDVGLETTVGGTILQQKIVEKGKPTTKLSYRNKIEIMRDLAKAYEGHPDEMEFYGAMIAQTRLLKGAGDSNVISSEHLSNYISGFTSCRSKDVLFSQMEFSQTKTNDTETNNAAPTAIPLASRLVPFGCLPTSASGAPQRKRLKSHREKGVLTNSKKQKAVCGFCWLPGHTIKQCDLLKNFAGNATEILVDDKKDFAWRLVNTTRLFQVEQNPKKRDWQNGGLPLDTHHVVILAMLVDFTVSNYASSTANAGGSTGLLVRLLSNKGQNCNGHIGPSVYRAQSVLEWIMNRGAAKTKRLFSCLKPCSQVPQRDAMMAEI